MPEVKELATKLGEVVLTGRGKRINVGGKYGLLSPKECEALARVALEYCEERGRDNLAANIIPKLVELKRLSIALNKFVSSCAHELGEVAYPPKEDE